MNIKHIKRGPNCLNCGQVLNPESDNFCPVCGQVNQTKKETAFGLIRELVEEFLHLDSKVMGSIVPLLFKPGKLTKDYNAGMRARYFHPVRLFLTVTVIMFIAVGIMFSSHDLSEESHSTQPTSQEAPTNIVIDNEGVKVDKDTLPDEQRRNLTIGFEGKNVKYETIDSLVKKGVTNPKVLMDTLGVPDGWLNKIVMRQAVRFSESGTHSFTEYFKHHLPWILFSMMPVFAFVLFLLYIRRRMYFVDHLIFAFHLHTATFLIIALEALMEWGFGDFWTILFLYIPVYYFIALKQVYAQSWAKTVLKGIMTGVLYLVLGGITFLFVSAIMVMIY